MPDDDVKERIRNALDIVEVIGERIPLKKAGKNFVARCPFHTEKTPSFNVNPERQIYHCFGCGVGGDVFSFVMEFDKVSFPEALRTLANRAGIALTDQRGVRARAKEEAYDVYYEANGLAREFFVETLNDPRKGKPALEYLVRRGLSTETIRKFGIGYAPDSWDGFLSLARMRGIQNDVLVESGLVVKNEQGRLYDRFRGRVAFPIVNQSGRVVGFGARTLDPEGEPKYVNSSESPVYQKGRILYGFFHARDAMRREGWVMIVEGYMDVLSVMQAGIESVVATCGTALTREHGQLLRRHAEKVILVFDGDEAGVRAATRAGDVLLEAGIEASVALLPEGDDPDTYVMGEGPEALRTLALHGTPYLRFKWDQLGREHDLSTVTGRNRAIDAMLDAIAPVADEIVQNLMAGQVSDWGQVDDRDIHRAIAKRRKRSAGRALGAPGTPSTPRWNPPGREKTLVAWMFGRPWVCQMVAEMGTECLTDALLREMATTLVLLSDEGKEPGPSALIDRKPGDRDWASAVTELSQEVFDERYMEREGPLLVVSLRLPYVLEEMRRLRAKINELTRQGTDMAEVLQLQGQIRDRKAEYDRLDATFTRRTG